MFEMTLNLSIASLMFIVSDLIVLFFFIVVFLDLIEWKEDLFSETFQHRSVLILNYFVKTLIRFRLIDVVILSVSGLTLIYILGFETVSKLF